jgi:outer membrane protein assembly factor BamC
VDPLTDQKDKGLLARLFSSSAAPAPLKYRIVLRSEADRTTVSVLDAQGQPDTSANAKRIVQVIADDLK